MLIICLNTKNSQLSLVTCGWTLTEQMNNKPTGRHSDGNLSRLMTKPTKWHVRLAKTQISLGIRPVWSESSLSAWRKLGSLATHWVDSEDSDQTGRTPRLIWVFTGRTDHFVCFVVRWLICTPILHPAEEDLSHVMRKPVFGVCDQVILKPVCSGTETS